MYRKRVFRRRKTTNKRKGWKSSKSSKTNRPRRMPDGLSKVQFLRQRYVDRFESIVIPLASYNQYPYANNLYDPYANIGGHQTMFYDQMIALYEKWVVLGMAYKIQINPYSSAGTFVVFPTTDLSYIPTTISAALEQKGARSIELNTNTGIRFMRGYISVAKMFSLSPKQIMTDSAFWGSSLGGPVPTSTMYIRFMFFSTVAASFTYTANIQITYYVKWFQPKNLAPS